MTYGARRHLPRLLLGTTVLAGLPVSSLAHDAAQPETAAQPVDAGAATTPAADNPDVETIKAIRVVGNQRLEAADDHILHQVARRVSLTLRLRPIRR